MTKKKRSHPSVEEVLARPWCYYCERDFDDLKILLNHQKAKHFKCEKCYRRLNTAGGLSVHMNQVHKESLEAVENALPNRQGLNVEIFGMEGVPEDIVQQHNQRVIQEYHQNQADRRAATGNPTPGTAEGNVAKKPKLEEPSDLKARLAAFKARKAAGEQPGQAHGNGTPTGAGQAAQSPGMSNSPAPYQAGSPVYPQFPSQASPPPQQYQQPYGQQGFNMPPQPPFPQSSSPFPHGPPGGFPQQQPPQAFQSPMQQYPSYGAPPQMPFGVTSPPPSAYNGHQVSSPSQSPGMFNRPPGLPPIPGMPPGGLAPAPGLPSRPSFQAPPVNAQQLQQMHHGQYQGRAEPTQDPRQRPQQERAEPADVQPQATEADVDELISNAAKELSAQPPAPIEQTETAPPAEKKGKKDKDKATRLVYGDNDVSPEEKMATMNRYAFDRSKEPEDIPMEAGTEAAGAHVTGPVVDQDDVIDNQGD